MNKKTLQFSLFFSLLILAVPFFSVRADDKVSITVQMSGDAYVTITNSNGTIIFNYNGENVMPELLDDVDWLKARANSNKLAIMLIRQDFNRLIMALNDTFSDLYGKVYFLAHVTGIYNGNDNSTVTLMIKSGNMTIADFIDQLLNITERQNIRITDLSLQVASDRQETQKKLNRVFQEISVNRRYFEDQLKTLDKKIDALHKETNSTFTQVFNNLELLKMYEATNTRSTQIALICIAILNIIMVALIVWIAGWKAEKIKQQ